MKSEPRGEISDLVRGGEARIEAGGDAAALMKRLEQAGRRGQLPGFVRTGGDAFRLDCDAVPFEHAMFGEARSAGGGSVVALRVKRRRLMPAIFIAVLIVTVWPGVVLTDSLMSTYWESYGRWSAAMPWLTYAWYLPLTVLPIPWIWRKASQGSAAMASESAEKLVATVRRVVAPAEPVDGAA